MTITWGILQNAPRLLLEAQLQPVQGNRFQPTRFPDLGAAVYDALSENGDTVQMVLVESAQSVANRLESVCWDDATGYLSSPVTGMPYIKVNLWDGKTTNSIQEAHRLNSPYIMNESPRQESAFKEELRQKAGIPERTTGRRNQDQDGDNENQGGVGKLDRRLLARAAFYYDPCSVLHGVFLEKLDGRARLQRCLSGFVEASQSKVADSGGVKNDQVAQDPRGLGFSLGEGARLGYGNVPFHRTEYTAERITAYFNLDLAQIRAYGLGENAERFLVTLALWKVRKFLDTGLRLRTACDLDMAGELEVTRPVNGFIVPFTTELEADLPALIQACADDGLFANPPVTELTFQRR